MKYFYFIVEGVHDIAAIGKYLKINGYSQIRNMTNLDDFWIRTVPTKFPFNNDLKKRVPVPAFYSTNNISIAIQYSEGDTEIVNTFNTLKNIDHEDLSGIAIFCDADNKVAEERYGNLIQKFQQNADETLKVIFREHTFNNIQENDGIKFGIYIFPDNIEKGTLEKLLLEGAEQSYPELLVKARGYIEDIKIMDTPYIKERLFKGSKEDKMLFGIMANVFKPGKANQVSIEDDDWITIETQSLSKQKPFFEFLNKFLE